MEAVTSSGSDSGHKDRGNIDRVKNPKTIVLELWQEIVGRLELLFVEEESLVLQLRTEAKSVRLLLELQSPATERIRDVLAECPINSRLGVVITDNEMEPILVRRIKE